VISLPYEFHTASTWRRIGRIALGLLALVVVLPLVALAIGKPAAALQLTLVLAIALFVAFRLRGIASFGAVGTVTAAEVVARPMRVWGIPMRVSAGRFPIAGFHAIRLVRRLVSPRGGPVRDVGDVQLLGRDGIPDIDVFSGPVHDARAAAADFCALLELEFVEGVPPGMTRIALKLGG